MTFAGYLFLISGFLIAVVAGQKSRMRSVSSLALPTLYLYHIGMTLYYWSIAVSSIADASFYYAQSAYPARFGISNEFIIWIIHTIRVPLDGIAYGTMLDYFILFGTIGFIGFVYLYNILADVLFAESQELRPLAVLLLLVCIFSPGLNFWTSAIGKDGVIFTGVCMAAYGVMDWRKRWLHLILGLAIVFLARPYILAFVIVAGAVQFLIAGRVSMVARAAGLIVVAVATYFAGPAIVDFTGLGSVDVLGVRDYIEVRQGQNLEGGSSVDISQYNFVFQVLTYLFRPLFFDANNMTALAASFDNALLVFIVLLALANVRVYRGLVREPPILLNLLFAGAGISALAMTTANLGIAVRQKTMFLPSLFIVIAWGLEQARLRRLQRAQQHRMAVAQKRLA